MRLRGGGGVIDGVTVLLGGRKRCGGSAVGEGKDFEGGAQKIERKKLIQEGKFKGRDDWWVVKKAKTGDTGWWVWRWGLRENACRVLVREKELRAYSAEVGVIPGKLLKREA